MGEAGVSLLELMVAVSLLTIVVATLSTQFPAGAHHIVTNRQRWIATNLANSQIASLHNQMYSSLDTTDITLGTDFNTNCDCSTYDFTGISSTPVVTAGTVFSVASCVNYSSNTQTGYNPQCADAGPDTGIKTIQVRVLWSTGASTGTVTQATSITAS